VEPGLVYARGATVLFVSVPVVTQQNVRSQIPGVARESTFADYQIDAGVTHRFGKERRPLKVGQVAKRTLLIDGRCKKCGELHAPDETVATATTTGS
jgi:hypothetical protein